MMTRQQYLFGKLAEECAELAKEAIKCQQFGVLHVFGNAKGVTNIERLNGEFNDVMGVIDMLNENITEEWQPTTNVISVHPDKVSAKVAKVQRWFDVAQEMGMVK